MLEDPRPIRLSLEPLDDVVVVEPTDEEAETRAGLIIPASAEAQCSSGIHIFYNRIWLDAAVLHYFQAGSEQLVGNSSIQPIPLYRAFPVNKQHLFTV